MSFDQLVPTDSKYLKQGDVGEDGVILTIRGFKQEDMKTDDGSTETKVILHFVEDGYKPMVLNRTNSELVGKATGAANAGEARGKQIVVYADPSVGFGGKVTGGLRIKKVAGAPAIPRQAAQAHEMESDVPF
jgi:hypothetical protein